MPFEPDAAPFLTGTVSLSVADATGIAPPVIISGDATATVQWSISGLTVPLMAADNHFLITLFLERIGPGGDLSFPLVGPVDVLLGSEPLVGDTRSYSVDIPIPNADVPNGPYTVTAVITSVDPAGLPASMAGFFELGMRQWA